MNDKRVCISDLISEFNKSELRHRIIPMEMASGWPCIHKLGETLCITIPYFLRTVTKERKVAIKSLYCSVTLPVANPKRLMDFTIYPYQRDWDDVNYTDAVGMFPHEALQGITKEEYKDMCESLYGCYDDLTEAVMSGAEYKGEEMQKLFSVLMEPFHYPQYLKINKKFYSYFCKTEVK